MRRASFIAAVLGLGVLGTIGRGDVRLPANVTRDGRIAITVPTDAPAAIDITGDDLIPTHWNRGTHREAMLPLLAKFGATGSTTITRSDDGSSFTIDPATIPHATIDARAYAKLATWRPTSSPADRRATLLLAVGFATTLLLAALLQRGRAIALIGVAVAWSVGLAVAAHHRPTLIVRDEEGGRWFLATEAQKLRLPIEAGKPWVPVVESLEHLNTLSPRIEVEGDAATIEFKLRVGGKIGVRASDPLSLLGEG